MERSKSSLHFIGAPAQNSHTVFVDEEEAVSFRPEEHFDTPAELLGRTYNRPRRPQLTDPAALTGLGRNLNKLERCGLITHLLRNACLDPIPLLGCHADLVVILAC